MPSKPKKNNYSYSTSVPQKSQSGSTKNQPEALPRIAYDKALTLRRNWDSIWAEFPGDRHSLRYWQANICAAVVDKLLSKGVRFPADETSRFTPDESNLIWFSYKYCELKGLVGGVR